MNTILDARQLLGRQMTLAMRAHGDFDVSVADHLAGRITRVFRPGGASVWRWTLTGPFLRDLGLSSSGEEASLPEAKEAFRKAFDMWLTATIVDGQPALWHYTS